MYCLLPSCLKSILLYTFSVVSFGQFSYVHIREPLQLPTFRIPFKPTFPEFFSLNHLPSLVSLTRFSSVHFILYITLPFISHGFSTTCLGVTFQNRPGVSFFFWYFGGLLWGIGRGGKFWTVVVLVALGCAKVQKSIWAICTGIFFRLFTGNTCKIYTVCSETACLYIGWCYGIIRITVMLLKI